MIPGGLLSKTQNRQSTSKTKSSSHEASVGTANSGPSRDARKLSREGGSSSGGFVERARAVVRKAFPHAEGEPLRLGRQGDSVHVSSVLLHLAATGEITEPVRAHLRDCTECAAKLADLKRRLAS